jgi:hypothetical protein
MLVYLAGWIVGNFQQKEVWSIVKRSKSSADPLFSTKGIVY